MNADELKTKIEGHVKKAYALVPFPIERLLPCDKPEYLPQSYENQDWCSVYHALSNYRKINHFSGELVRELETAQGYMNQLNQIYFHEAMHHMNDHDIKVIGECLNAVVDSPILSDADIEILSGRQREDFAAVAECWPNYDKDDCIVPGAVGSALFMLLSYPHHKEAELSRWFSVPYAEAAKVGDKWFTVKQSYRLQTNQPKR